jgi:DNA-binding PadR family transcriptional regulator
MSLATLRLLSVFMQDPTKPAYGLELVKAVRSRSGTIYPILARLERAGWIRGEWEDISPSEERRPRRRFYTLTGLGERRAREEITAHLASLEAVTGRPSFKPIPQGFTA